MSTVASPASISYLGVIWGERTDAPFDVAQFATRSQMDVSAMIDSLKVRDALPATEDQLDEIAALSSTVGVEIEKTADRAQANRQLIALRKTARRVQFDAAKTAAAAELDALFAGAELVF